ncbi:HPF/RaiA family ribosome-associated protein [Candidatus Daviesbacteria bacterium]|nr:HPF/RaiA family ribosome-associated protein [Candidatus Daviesbacteria bacterium]
MIFKLTTKNCQVSERLVEYIHKHVAKLDQSLPGIESDLVVLRLLVRKNIDKYHPPRNHPHLHRSYADLKSALAFFEGSITFRLNKNRLYVHFKGQTMEECIDVGFKRIFKELEKYKDLHFPSGSEYPDHSSIRGREL